VKAVAGPPARLHGHDSLNAEERIRDESYHVIIDTGVSVLIARPEITARLPDRDLAGPYILQLASGKTLPILKEVLVEFTWRWHPLMSWLFIAEITDEFVPGQDLAAPQCICQFGLPCASVAPWDVSVFIISTW
jgi:hypothetical protein